MNQTAEIFVGVDGGASKCIVQVENDAGTILGKETTQPASLRQNKAHVWSVILEALQSILERCHLDNKKVTLHVCIGIAGCEAKTVMEDFKNFSHGFKTLLVLSDAHTACFGAHNGENGAIIIAGTGSVGFQIEGKKTTQIGGWGFPQDDEGSGAWIGLEAVKKTVKSLDGRMPHCELTQAIIQHFSSSSIFIEWLYQAKSKDFATLAPLVIQHATVKQKTAEHILKQAAANIERMAEQLFSLQTTVNPLPCTLLGGVAPFLQPYLNAKLKQRLSAPQKSAESGAILLLRQHLQGKANEIN